VSDAEPVEIELKYRLADAAVGEALLARSRLGPFEADGDVVEELTDDQFLDTPGGAFRGVREAVRLRTVTAGTMVTLKGPGRIGVGGEHQRTELEGRVAGDRLDPHTWPPSAARDRIRAIAGDDPLVEIAALRQRRCHRRLRAGETVVDLSVDEVEVLDGGRTAERFTEIEAELAGGPAEPLAGLADVLDATAGVTPSPESKFAAALRVLGLE